MTAELPSLRIFVLNIRMRSIYFQNNNHFNLAQLPITLNYRLPQALVLPSKSTIAVTCAASVSALPLPSTFKRKSGSVLERR